MKLRQILVRATINLSGLRVGEEALVDPNDPYVCDCLKQGYLVPLEKR